MRGLSKEITTRLAAVIVGLLVPLLALEGVVRALSGKVPPSTESSPERPAHYYLPVNATTARGNVFSVEKPTGVFRIGVVGDSFTFAPKMQFFDTFSARLERMLNLAGSKTRVEVINYGSPGFSTHHEVDLVRNALRAQCDLVVLEITLNDAQESPLGFNPLVSKPATTGWRSYSKLWQRVSAGIEGISSRRRYIQYHYDLFTNPETRSLFEKALALMKDDTTANNVPFVAVVFPLLDFPIDDTYPFKELHRTITDLLHTKGVSTLDLEGAFTGLDVKRLQLIPGRDSHPNEIGHRIAADAIYEWLKKEKLVPEQFFTPKAQNSRERVYDLPGQRAFTNVKPLE